MPQPARRVDRGWIAGYFLGRVVLKFVLGAWLISIARKTDGDAVYILYAFAIGSAMDGIVRLVKMNEAYQAAMDGDSTTQRLRERLRRR